MEKVRILKRWDWKIPILGLLGMWILLPGWFAGEMPLVAKRVEGSWEINLLKANILSENRSHGEYVFAWYAAIPFHPVKAQLKEGKFLPPLGRGYSGKIHWLGTDHLGRDVLSGIIWGARTSLLVGFVAVAVALLFGVLLGPVVGYYGVYPLRLKAGEVLLGVLALTIPLFFVLGGIGGVWTLALVVGLLGAYLYLLALKTLRIGKYEINIEGFTNAWLNVLDALPGLIIAIVFFMLYPKMNIWSLGVLLGILKMPVFYRILSGEVRHWVVKPFVMSALLEQKRWIFIFFTEVWPNLKYVVYLHSVYAMASAIITESTLSFLSLGGMTTDYVSWGMQLSLSRNYIGEWWLALFPGLCIFFVILFLRNTAKGWEKRSIDEF
jgi:peptide/nickel transport system permease protein